MHYFLQFAGFQIQMAYLFRFHFLKYNLPVPRIVAHTVMNRAHELFQFIALPATAGCNMLPGNQRDRQLYHNHSGEY